MTGYAVFPAASNQMPGPLPTDSGGSAVKSIGSDAGPMGSDNRPCRLSGRECLAVDKFSRHVKRSFFCV